MPPFFIHFGTVFGMQKRKNRKFDQLQKIMKKVFITINVALLAAFLPSCDVLEDAAQIVTTPAPSKPQLTNAEVISGLKEALNVGIKNSVSLTSVTDAFFKNTAIKLPFPQDAIKVREKDI